MFSKSTLAWRDILSLVANPMPSAAQVGSSCAPEDFVPCLGRAQDQHFPPKSQAKRCCYGVFPQFYVLTKALLQLKESSNLGHTTNAHLIGVRTFEFRYGAFTEEWSQNIIKATIRASCPETAPFASFFPLSFQEIKGNMVEGESGKGRGSVAVIFELVTS